MKADLGRGHLTDIQKVSPAVRLREEREFYVARARESEKDTQKYLNDRLIHMLSLDKYVGMSFDLRKKMELDYRYYKGISDFINKKAMEEGLCAVFVTLTLPSEYHRYKIDKKTQKHIVNPLYCPENTINKGYRLLQNASREMLRHFKRYTENRRSYDIKYIKTVEMHKDFTPHIHFIAYFPYDLFEDFSKIVESKISLFGLGKEYKIELLQDSSKGSAYVLKYLSKTLLSEEDVDLYLLDGWKKANKIRIFTHSQTFLHRRDFMKILPHFKDNVEEKVKELLRPSGR